MGVEQLWTPNGRCLRAGDEFVLIPQEQEQGQSRYQQKGTQAEGGEGGRVGGERVQGSKLTRSQSSSSPVGRRGGWKALAVGYILSLDR